MEPLDNETATTAIKGLVDRGFIVWLAPENRRGATLTHGFHAADELQRLKSAHAAGVGHEELRAPAPAPAPISHPAAPDRVAGLEARLTDAVADIARLREEVRQLRATVVSLQEALGVTPAPTG
jgi:hypothetical protein